MYFDDSTLKANPYVEHNDLFLKAKYTLG